MSSTLINLINTSLGAGTSASSDYIIVDSCYTAIRVWAYVNQNMNVKIVFADSSSGDASVTETFPVYRNHTSAINTVKKKAYAKTIVTNPTDGIAASKVVVKTFHAVRDPNPVVTYNTDDITLQGNFDMDAFDLSLGTVQTEVSMSSMQFYGSVTSNDVSNYRIILTDTCGHPIVVTDNNFPLSITSSASETEVQIYGTDGTSNIQARTDASGRFEVVSTASNPVHAKLLADTSVVLVGTTTAGNQVNVAVSSCGELLTNIQDTALTGPTNLYATATHISADSSTSAMDIGTFSRQVNIMGQSSQLCDLQVWTSPDGTTYYDTIYTGLVKAINTNFVINVPCTERYIKLVPNVDTSLILKYTY